MCSKLLKHILVKMCVLLVVLGGNVLLCLVCFGMKIGKMFWLRGLVGVQFILYKSFIWEVSTPHWDALQHIFQE